MLNKPVAFIIDILFNFHSQDWYNMWKKRSHKRKVRKYYLIIFPINNYIKTIFTMGWWPCNCVHAGTEDNGSFILKFDLLYWMREIILVEIYGNLVSLVFPWAVPPWWDHFTVICRFLWQIRTSLKGSPLTLTSDPNPSGMTKADWSIVGTAVFLWIVIMMMEVKLEKKCSDLPSINLNKSKPESS